MRKNWKTKSWKDFSFSARFWLFVTFTYLVSFIAITISEKVYNLYWPKWLLIIWLVSGLFVVYKLASSVGMLNDDDDDDDDDDDPQSLTR